MCGYCRAYLRLSYLRLSLGDAWVRPPLLTTLLDDPIPAFACKQVSWHPNPKVWSLLAICKHCRRPVEEHAEQTKCLSLPTSYELYVCPDRSAYEKFGNWINSGT